MAPALIQGALSALERALTDYSSWWLQLYKDSPTHVIIETSLIVSMLYILLIKRSYDPAKRGGRRAVELSEREEEELLQEWAPEPLVPAGAENAPPPHDFVISEYLPNSRQVVVRIAGPDSKPKVTFCSQDFLGNGVAPEVREMARETLMTYTVGSCGPRGFYGTTKPHLELEDSLASFMGTSESITYSDSTATTASAIPAFAKRGDVLLVDAGASFAVQLGARLSRSKTLYFRHNDMSDLQRHLQAVRDRDEADGDDSLVQRRFIVVEGLYGHFGDLCPLPEVLRLAREYKWRVILDDSCGIGVLGATGRGAVEHYGLSTADVDVLIGSLATSLASVGGFCVGSREVVDHQRLSGAGYCFSASAPPFTCAVATASLRRVMSSPGLLATLRDRCVAVHHALGARVPGFTVTSDPVSPIKHLLLTVGPAGHYPRGVTADMLAVSPPAAGGAGASGGGSNTVISSASRSRLPLPSPTPLLPTPSSLLQLRHEEDAILRVVVARAAAGGVLVTRSHYLDTECTAPRPTLKFCVTLAHSEAEIEALILALAAAATAALGVPALAKQAASNSSSNGGSAPYRDRAVSGGGGLLSPAPKASPQSASKRIASKSRA